MSFRRVARVVAFAVVLWVSGTFQTEGISVYFGDTNRGPADTLSVDGISIGSGALYPSQPGTVLDSGLGSGSVGPLDSVDWSWNYAQGSVNQATRNREGLSLSVAGAIQSITLAPRLTVSGYSGEVDFPFYCRLTWFYGDQPFAEQYQEVNPLTPISITPLSFPGSAPYRVDLDVDSYGENDQTIAEFRQQNGTPDACFDLGFTVVSMNYTPMPVPEPSAASVVVAGALSAFWLKRRRRTPEFRTGAFP